VEYIEENDALWDKSHDQYNRKVYVVYI